MLPGPYRLRKRNDFKRVYSKGKTLNTRFFRIKTAPNNLDVPRFGVVISNKVIKTAVGRNKKKRQIRAMLRDICVDVKPGYDIVLVTTPEATNTNFSDIVEDVRAGLGRIGFLKV